MNQNSIIKKSGYDLELLKVINEIKQRKAKSICIQLPEGLKSKAGIISDYIEKKTKSQVYIFANSCFGGCDTPDYIEELGVDMLVQWGHDEFTAG